MSEASGPSERGDDEERRHVPLKPHRSVALS